MVPQVAVVVLVSLLKLSIIYCALGNSWSIRQCAANHNSFNTTHNTLWLADTNQTAHASFTCLAFSCQTPGPGTYKITSTDRVKRKMPAYTIKGRNYMPCDNTQKPGPGAHSPEKVGWPTVGMGVGAEVTCHKGVEGISDRPSAKKKFCGKQ